MKRVVGDTLFMAGFIVIAILLAVGISFVSKHHHQAQPVAAATPKPKEPFTVEKLFSTLNGYRIYGGTAGVSRDFTLDRAAQLHAEDMKKRGYYDHTSPDGVTAYQRIYTAVGREVYAGENQDNVCENPSVGDEFVRFSNSPEHNTNMLDPKINYVGIGYAPSDPGVCNGYIVFDFVQE